LPSSVVEPQGILLKTTKDSVISFVREYPGVLFADESSNRLNTTWEQVMEEIRYPLRYLWGDLGDGDSSSREAPSWNDLPDSLLLIRRVHAVRGEVRTAWKPENARVPKPI